MIKNGENMTPQDIITIIGVNITLFAALAAMLYWMINRVDMDVKNIGTRIDKMDARLDGHAMRIDQLYRMFVDLLKEGRK
jgi:hypothetical protein